MLHFTFSGQLCIILAQLSNRLGYGIVSISPHSLCILRLSAIGDVCNTIAAVQAIQRQWPQTRITWVTGKLEAELIQSLPDIQVIVFDKNSDGVLILSFGSN